VRLAFSPTEHQRLRELVAGIQVEQYLAHVIEVAFQSV
jgi:hypothetical protein